MKLTGAVLQREMERTTRSASTHLNLTQPNPTALYTRESSASLVRSYLDWCGAGLSTRCRPSDHGRTPRRRRSKPSSQHGRRSWRRRRRSTRRRCGTVSR